MAIQSNLADIQITVAHMGALTDSTSSNCKEASEELVLINSVASHHHNFSSFMDINRFSNLQKLLRVSAYILRFLRNCRQSNRNLRHTGQLLPVDIDEATHAWIHCAQRASFPEEFSALQ